MERDRVDIGFTMRSSVLLAQMYTAPQVFWIAIVTVVVNSKRSIFNPYFSIRFKTSIIGDSSLRIHLHFWSPLKSYSSWDLLVRFLVPSTRFLPKDS